MMIGMGMPRSQRRMPRMGAFRCVPIPRQRGLPPRAPGAAVAGLSGPCFVNIAAASGQEGRVRSGRRAMALLFCLAVAGCGTNPNAPYLWGLGDPVRGAALSAPRNFGDTGRWAGQPAQAAFAVEQLEFLTSELATNPIYAPVINPAALQTLQAARTEMRGYLGIPASADPQMVIEAMRRAGAALRAGSRA